MDLEDQGTIKAKSEEVGAGNVVVLLGSPDPDAAEMYAETVTLGDPTYAGPLTGVSLRLPVYFITEPEIKRQIPPDVYREQVEMMEMVLPMSNCKSGKAQSGRASDCNKRLVNKVRSLPRSSAETITSTIIRLKRWPVCLRQSGSISLMS